METILYSDNMGEGLILNNDVEPPVKSESPIVGDEILIPGTFTSLSGYFAHSLKFCGVMDKNKLVFYIGESNDLFNKVKYYQVLHLISQIRLFSMFTYKGGRDFNFVNGKWKWNMATKTKTAFNINDIPEVSCLDCVYQVDDDGVVAFCNKIKMPQPSKELKRCVLKEFKSLK